MVKKVRLLTLTCKGCGRGFKYMQHKSPNYPQYCIPCAKNRKAAAQEMYERRGRKYTATFIPKEIFHEKTEEDSSNAGPKDVLRVIDTMMRCA